MSKQKTSFWQFLLKIGDDYFYHWRYSHCRAFALNAGIWMMSFGDVFRQCVFHRRRCDVVNLVCFAKKTVKALRILHNQEEKETEGCLATVKEL